MSIGNAGVGPAQGLSPATLELLADPKKLEKTLASLRDAQEKAQKAIELAGPATEILTLRAEAELEVDKQRAVTEETQAICDAKLASAQEDAQRMRLNAKSEVEAAHAEANSIRAAAEKEASAIKSRAEKVETGLVEKKEAAEQALADLASAQSEIASRTSELDARSKKLDDLNTSLLEEKATLKQLREQLNAALG